MLILALRTDKPEAELYLYDRQKKLAVLKWQANLKLAETLNKQLKNILNKSSISLNDLQGIAIYKGPGSFTGLRIGMSIANALAYSQSIPIVAKNGDDWIKMAIKGLISGQSDKLATPEYGAPVRVTKPKK
ncbi:tRNA (adenosine(37)-N6)-threonylcarbamoyltransferase complex dimerization subunit type 1 TsaB [Candidatus Saccharibacteria bacterium]|nr:tRNA (adenosine(37)-N6)-threonylcarbamoyltransferase complex dimerization subunit type 1 TsaB [Candidatus Saccharibacteria bacterium]